MTTGMPGQTYAQPVAMPARLKSVALGVALVALPLLAAAAWADWLRFLTNTLVLFVFLLTIGLGALFLVTLEHTVGATWSIVLRRIPENLAGLVPVSLLLAVPVLLGLDRLYEWTYADVLQNDPLLAAKSTYLNVPFFLLRFILFYAVWLAGYRLLTGASRRQDQTGDTGLSRRVWRLSPVFMILLVVTITFASFDWIMSLAPHWYSSIFGIYLLVSSIVSGVAAVTLTGVLLKSRGLLPDRVGADHFYNLGALLFAVNTAWAYIAFAQFLLIWYGNLPHETVWYAVRASNGWGWVSWLLIIGHFIVPFLALLSRAAKMDLKRLRWVSLWVLAAHGLDMYWLVAPSTRPSGPPFGWQELWLPCAATAVALLVWLRKSAQSPLLPVRDPGLESSLQFHL